MDKYSDDETGRNMRKVRKIAYVVTKSDGGGAQRYVYDLATNIQRGYFDVSVLAGGSGPLFGELKKAGVITKAIPALERDIRIFADISAFLFLLRFFIRERPDIIHLNSPKIGGLGGVAAKIASLITGHCSLVVYTVHGWAFFEDRSFMTRWLIRFFSWLSSLTYDVVILVDRHDLDAALSFIPRQKCTLIPNGISPIATVPRREARSLLLGTHRARQDESVVLMGTVAELTRTKGLRYLIEAASILRTAAPVPRFKIVIVGDGDERMMLESLIKSNHVQDTVILRGRVDRAALYFSGLDVFVLPSVKEGLPYVILEAMSSGIPIIATDVGGIPDLVLDGTNGILVNPRNPLAIAEALQILINDPERRTSFGAQSKQIMTRQFGLEQMVTDTVRVYQGNWSSRAQV